MADRILRGTAANREVTFYGDETPADADGAVTVTVTHVNGTVLIAGGATVLQGVGTGRYRYTLPAQVNVAHLTEVWTGTFGGSVQTVTTYVEIVGGFYVALGELRAMKNLSDTARFTTAELVDARAWFETTFEDFTGVAWVPRYAREVVAPGRNSPVLLDHFPVRRVFSISYRDAVGALTAYTVSELADVTAFLAADMGSLVLPTARAWNGYGLVVEYEHGHAAADSDIRKAAKEAIRDHLLGESVGNRQFSVSTQDGVVRTSTPGNDRPFGLPFADEVAVRRRQKAPAIG